MGSKKLPPQLKKWLLSVHILLVVAWLGGMLCMLALILTASQAQNLAELSVTTRNLIHIDDLFIKAPAMGVLLTGLLLSIFSNWGLTRYYWIITKLVLTILLILFGMFGLNRWTMDVMALINNSGWDALRVPAYDLSSRMMLYGAITNSALMAFMVVISSLKPWGKVRSLAAQR